MKLINTVEPEASERIVTEILNLPDDDAGRNTDQREVLASD